MLSKNQPPKDVVAKSNLSKSPATFFAKSQENLFGLECLKAGFVVGNCLFDSLSVLTPNMSSQLLREKALDMIKSNKEIYQNIEIDIASKSSENFVQKNSGERIIYRDIGEYLNLMSQDKAWGTEREIAALALALDCPIVLMKPEGPYIENRNGSNPAKFIKHSNRNHFEPLFVPAHKTSSGIITAVEQALNQAAIQRNRIRETNIKVK